MTPETKIRCQCGHRVTVREVLQAGLHVNGQGTPYVYVRFRCARCKKVGQRLVHRQAWAEEMLEPIGAALSGADRERFERLGPITPDEILGFHEGVERL
jgi:DNA-directed RNA polymerase subunit RPC12/RpoP